MGASSGYSEQAIKLDEMDILDEPYQWHRRWDEELQADWLEQVYTLYYSKQNIKCITVPKRTYISVPFLANKLGIELKWKDEKWVG